MSLFTSLFSKVLALMFTLLLELSSLLSLPLASKTLQPAQPDGTAALPVAEQSLARAEVLSESYYKQYFSPLLNRLSFYPNSFRTASCWEYIGLLSLTYKLAVSDSTYLQKLDGILEGLKHYRRQNADDSFAGYAVNWNIRKNAPASEDIAYDDNMWLGRDFVNLYELTGDARYLGFAIEIGDWLIANAYVELPQALFAEKGWPVKQEPVGGFYWSYNKDALHTCSNGPAAQFLAALYRVSNTQKYLDYAKAAYNFLSYLENDAGVFHDLLRFEKDANNNIIGIRDHDKATYSYNSGSPITAAVELYRITGQEQYLQNAKHWATAADAYYAKPTSIAGAMQYPSGNAQVWFHLILLNGYVALAPYAPETSLYIEHLRGSIHYAYDSYRTEGILGVNENILPTDWVNGFPQGETYQPVALDVSAAAEIYATLHIYDLQKH